MKRIMFILLALLMCANAHGVTSAFDIEWWNQNTYSNNPSNTLRQWAEGMEGRVSENVGTGSIFYADSGVTNEGDGTSWENAKNTIEEAYDLCSANRGDYVYVAQGHAETLGTLVLDTEGVTIIGIGKGEDRPEITFDGTGDIITISGASNTIMNMSFRAGVSAVATGINITGDGDYTTIWGCDFPEPSTSSFEFTTAIQLTTGADYVTVAFCSYKNADATGAAEFLDGGAGAVSGLAVVGNYIYGEFSVAAIFSDQTDLELLIKDNVITNMTTNLYAIQLGASATGWLIDNCLATDTYATGLEAGSLAVHNTTWVDYGQTDTVAVPYFANATGVARMSATEKAEIENEVDEALVVQELDHLVHVADNDDPADNSIIADLASSTSDWSTYVPSTDSQQAIRDAIDALSGIGLRGDVSSAGTASQIISTDLGGFGDDFFNTGWRAICTWDAGSAGAAPEGEEVDIVDYTSGTGTFDVEPDWSVALAETDKVMIFREEELNLDDLTMLGASENIWYVDSGAAGTHDVHEQGRSWVNAYTTLTACLDVAGTSGDVIYIAPGHSETLTAAYLINDAGVSIIGLGEGSLQPTFILNHVDAQWDVSVADVYIENIKFKSSLDNVKIGIDGATGCDGMHVKNCTFCNDASTDEILIAINLTTGSDDVVIEGCTFLTTGASSTEAIKVITGACDNLQIINNWIRGDYTVAAIWSDQALTDLLIKDNVVHQETASQHAIELTSTALGAITDNRLYADTYASILDPGSCLCTGNIAVDALDQQGIPIPLSAETTDVTEVANGSDLERLEWLQNKSDDILAGIRMAGGTIGNVFYVDDATGSAVGGTSWENAEATMDGAHDECTADAGDIIFLAPDHEEDIATGSPLTWATAGVTIIGIGEGEQQPQVTFSGVASSININASSYIFDNINFHSTTADTTIGLDIKDAGDNSVIRNCLFTNASGLEFLSAVEINDDADNITIENCRFINTGGADATEAIKATAGTTVGMRLIGNYISGAYDAAGIYSDDIDTLVEVIDNVVYNSQTGVHAIEFTAAATGLCVGNKMYSDTMTSILDPGSLMCIDNWGVDATDEQAIRLPISAETSDVTEVADGSELERLELLQNLGNDALGLLGSGSTGKIVYVDSGETSGTEDGLTWATAHDTIDEGIADCSANVGDIVLVAAGHTEAITAGSIDLDIAGITVIGLGNGDNRPTLTYAATTGTVLFGADGDNSTLKNMRFIATIDSVATAVQVEAGCVNWTLEGCEFSAETGGTDEFDDTVLADGAACNGGTIKNCIFKGNTDSNADPQSAINFADVNDLHIVDCEFYGDRAVACIENSAAADFVVIKDNILVNGIIGGDAGLNTEPVMELNTATTGMIIDNTINCNVATPDLAIVAADCYLYNNYYSENEDSANNAQLIGLTPGQTYATSVAVSDGDDDLFDVAGGPILITSFTGLVTETVAGGAETTTVTFDGVDDFEFSTGVDITGVVRGSRIVFTAANAAVLTPLQLGAVGSSNLMEPWFCPIGMIEQTDDDDVSQAGGWTWYMTFIPLADGVTVTPQ